MNEVGIINITINEEDGKYQVAWDTTFTLEEMNLWLDRTKSILVDGEVSKVEE